MDINESMEIEDMLVKKFENIDLTISHIYELKNELKKGLDNKKLSLMNN